VTRLLAALRQLSDLPNRVPGSSRYTTFHIDKCMTYCHPHWRLYNFYPVGVF